MSESCNNHLSHWWNYQDPGHYCPYCCYIPERHRGFFRSQLGHLLLWDEVMKEMRYQCQLQMLPKGTSQTLPFHLDLDWNSDSGPIRMDPSQFCPCVLEGHLRDECRFGCHQLRLYNEQHRYSKVKEIEIPIFFGKNGDIHNELDDDVEIDEFSGENRENDRNLIRNEV